MYNNMKFSRKYYGRLFVEKEEDIEKVKEVMKEINPYEFENYYPTGNHVGGQGELIAVFNEDNLKSIYTHKFDDMDMGQVMIECWTRGIKCFMIDGKINQFDE